MSEFLIRGGTVTSSDGNSGDVIGPVSATDNAIVRFDATTGKLIQNSAITITDAGNLVLTGTIDGRDVSVDGAKLDTIEVNADVTDTTNVSAALSNSNISTVTPVSGDFILFQDISDSNSLRKTSIASLSGGIVLPLSGLASQAEATIVGRAVGAGIGVPSALTADQVRAVLSTGTVAQVVVGTMAGKVSTTTTIPADDTIPQNTEGAEFATVTITPKVATSTLVIIAQGYFVASVSAARAVISAFFVDSTVDAIATMPGHSFPSSGYGAPACIFATVSAGSTSSRVYKWRAGMNSTGTLYNYDNVNAGPPDDWGGTLRTSQMIVIEVLA